MSSVFLRRVVLSNYKSIAGCDVRLGPLTFLVGPNGAGKSNFLDALRLVADGLRTSLDHALRDRGGLQEVRRRSAGHPTHFGCRMELDLGAGVSGMFAFRVGALPHGAYMVQDEQCQIQSALDGECGWYHVRDGTLVNSSMRIAPPAARDRLYLVNAAGYEVFRPLYERLSRMGFYSLNPDRLRDLQSPDVGELLTRDGGNLPSVLAGLAARSPEMKHRIEEYLGKVVPGVSSVDSKSLGPKETVEFRQQVAGSPHSWRFSAASMSDGTLRALGVLVALFQGSESSTPRVPLVGIEEPETALHPAAAGALRDSLLEACRSTQVIVTSQSPDLLDSADVSTDMLLAVVSEEGVTKIAPVHEAGRRMLREHLYTAGELLRLDQLRPDLTQVPPPETAQLKLFDVSPQAA